MECQRCHAREAALHVTQVVNGEKREMHLCEKCAQEQGDMSMFSSSDFSLQHILAGLFSPESYVIPNQSKPTTSLEKQVVSCPRCGMTLQKFSKVGKVGCGECYETFEEHLKPALRRLHGGSIEHLGKVPVRAGENIHRKRHIISLKEKLKDLIHQEEFEEAAKVRDEIRLLQEQMGEE
ncbi:UvrB/UvrC motif-containing protein [Mangrovibacillus cuniculi]|uniref:UVR domain-containing protein n=1 Tax=Mangrovibacillus cuniculi TaxID=2593652 RepID=A0A7S8HGP5_9BACI|nr:UvrB/UvrC motif-containing protein [Mangrovibacillus cuniculi]QPC48007.1 hypothetical protein G8O30_14210 [Mangrovibacillus cuniculi]